jgi:hypothetical protein
MTRECVWCDREVTNLQGWTRISSDAIFHDTCYKEFILAVKALAKRRDDDGYRNA